MKSIFVWGNWKEDWTSGELSVIADSVEEARNIVLKAYEKSWLSDSDLEVLMSTPLVLDTTVSQIISDVAGGG